MTKWGFGYTFPLSFGYGLKRLEIRGKGDSGGFRLVTRTSGGAEKETDEWNTIVNALRLRRAEKAITDGMEARKGFIYAFPIVLGTAEKKNFTLAFPLTFGTAERKNFVLAFPVVFGKQESEST